MLQIEMFDGRVQRLSRSVTSGTDFVELVLQIEIEVGESFVCLNL